MKQKVNLTSKNEYNYKELILKKKEMRKKKPLIELDILVLQNKNQVRTLKKLN